MTTTVVTVKNAGDFIYVDVFVPFRESSRYVGQKAAGAARKFAKERVYRTTSSAKFHGNGDITYMYAYARA